MGAAATAKADASNVATPSKSIPPGLEFTAKKLLFLIVPLGTFIVYLVGLFFTLPQLEDDDKAAAISALKPPNGLQDAVVLRDILSDYSKDHGFHVALVVSSLYVFMQCFAIPGSITLSLLSGALFGFYKGLLLVSTVNLLGSSLCFAINTQVGRSIAYRVWPDKVKAFECEVDKRRSQMTNYMFFLRVTPFLPNTFINVVSPVVHVPYHSFALGSILGCLPNNFMAVKAGMHLSELGSLSELYDPNTIAIFAGIGFLVLLPALVTKPPDFLSKEAAAKKTS